MKPHSSKAKKATEIGIGISFGDGNFVRAKIIASERDVGAQPTELCRSTRRRHRRNLIKIGRDVQSASEYQQLPGT